MAAKYIDLLRMRFGSPPSVAQAITRPNISFLHTSSGSLRIRDSGGSLPAILFACDAPNVLEHYDAIFTSLSSSYRLVCLEMPGFGFSYPRSSFDFSLKGYVDVVAEIITKSGLGLGMVTLMFPCAWSYVAFLLATQHPRLVDRLVVSQCPHWDEEQEWSRRVGMSSGLMGTPILGQLFLAVSSKTVSEKWYNNALPAGKPTEDFAGPARKVLANGGIFCLASLAQTWVMAKGEEVQFEVQQPTVVMWGGNDRTHRRSNPESVLGYLRRGKVVVFPEAGHFPELEDLESLRYLLANEEMWNSMRHGRIEKGRGVEVGVSGRENLERDKNAAFSDGNHPMKVQTRKLPASHL